MPIDALGLAEGTELGISVKYPLKCRTSIHWKFKPSDITEIFFRLNRDIVIYGEVRTLFGR